MISCLSNGQINRLGTLICSTTFNEIPGPHVGPFSIPYEFDSIKEACEAGVHGPCSTAADAIAEQRSLVSSGPIAWEVFVAGGDQNCDVWCGCIDGVNENYMPVP